MLTEQEAILRAPGASDASGSSTAGRTSYVTTTSAAAARATTSL